MPESKLYKDGYKFGQFIKFEHENGNGGFDPRFSIADQARSLTKDEFDEWMRGLNAGCK